jgi:hypothetical protein
MPDWQIVTPAQMAVVTFRPRRAVDLHAVVDTLRDSGIAVVTSTTLNGVQALRFCTINPRTTEADIDLTLARLDEIVSAS